MPPRDGKVTGIRMKFEQGVKYLRPPSPPSALGLGVGTPSPNPWPGIVVGRITGGHRTRESSADVRQMRDYTHDTKLT